MQNSGIMHIPNPRRTERSVKHPRGSALRKELTTIIIFANYDYFCNISFSRSLLYGIHTMKFFNTGLIFSPEVFILCIKYGGRELGP